MEDPSQEILDDGSNGRGKLEVIPDLSGKNPAGQRDGEVRGNFLPEGFHRKDYSMWNVERPADSGPEGKSIRLNAGAESPRGAACNYFLADLMFVTASERRGLRSGDCGCGGAAS